MNQRAIARSYLFVPGNRPERFTKAIESGAHAVIIDLEDAVSHNEKAVAHAACRAYFQSGGSALIRINGLDTEWASEELILCKMQGVVGVVIPKVENASSINKLTQYLQSDVPLLPLIETANGMINVQDIAAAPGVFRLLFGTVDFCLDLCIEGSGEELAYYRSLLVLASRAARLQPPVDGVTVNMKDLDELVRAASWSRRVGFGGKLCIHPTQVSHVNSCFLPSAKESAWAHKVLDLAKINMEAFAIDGEMIDAPIIAKAKWILSQL